MTTDTPTMLELDNEKISTPSKTKNQLSQQMKSKPNPLPWNNISSTHFVVIEVHYRGTHTLSVATKVEDTLNVILEKCFKHKPLSAIRNHQTENFCFTTSSGAYHIMKNPIACCFEDGEPWELVLTAKPK